LTSAALHDDTVRGVQPVVHEPEVGDASTPGAAGLCLSGGGYRAMLFHLGTLWRLNEAGLLRTLDRISSVSGGSITAATLGLHWGELDWQEDVARNLEAVVVDRVRSLAGETIDKSSVIEGFLPFTSVGERVAHAYREHLFGDATLQDLPADGAGPQFVICATNMASGVLFRFSRPYVADWRVGLVSDPHIPLATAVAASSAFPPFLSPFELDLRDAHWQTELGNDLVTDEYRGKIALSDGGVYDNLGIETVWKHCGTVLISDGGGHVADEPDPATDWARHMMRVTSVIDGQVRALRKRQAVASYRMGLRTGTYWGIRSDVADYDLPDALPAPHATTMRLAATPTRLAKLPKDLQERLVNWGYVSCDTAVRRWINPPPQFPRGLPYPRSGLG
jgi:NTE family protein